MKKKTCLDVSLEYEEENPDRAWISCCRNTLFQLSKRCSIESDKIY